MMRCFQKTQHWWLHLYPAMNSNRPASRLNYNNFFFLNRKVNVSVHKKTTPIVCFHFQTCRSNISSITEVVAYWQKHKAAKVELFNRDTSRITGLFIFPHIKNKHTCFLKRYTSETLSDSLCVFSLPPANGTMRKLTWCIYGRPWPSNNTERCEKATDGGQSQATTCWIHSQGTTADHMYVKHT